MNRRSLSSLFVACLTLAAAALACGPAAADPPTVEILAPPNGAQTAVGQTLEVQFRAQDGQAIAWVQMKVNEDVVAVQEAPTEEGQPSLEGILRWTPAAAGTFNLVLTAHNKEGVQSQPAAVSVSVLETTAAQPSPTTLAPPSPSTAPPTQATPGQPPPTTAAAPQPTQPSAPPTQIVPTQPSPTQPSPPANTPIPQPEITLSADQYTLEAGQCTTVRWNVKNATTVYLEHTDRRAVPNQGQETYCYQDLIVGPNIFYLTAEGAGGGASTSVTITAQEPQSVILQAPFAAHLSGSVSDAGNVFPTIYPGDDAAYNTFIGFVSFDITQLPSDAIIQSAVLDLGPCSTRGNPFTDLAGQLYVTYLYYGDLDSGDFHASGGEYVGSVYDCPGGTLDVTASLDAHKAPPYYQLTLSWPVHSDFDTQIDDVTYTAPTLKITYTP